MEHVFVAVIALAVSVIVILVGVVIGVWRISRIVRQLENHDKLICQVITNQKELPSRISQARYRRSL